MTVKRPAWIAAWFILTAPAIFWDAGYCFARPRSFEGGDLHWIWAPYAIYQNVDLVYGVRAYEEMDGFPNAAAVLNIVETLLGLAYVYLAHISQWPGASLLGFTAASLTLAKTVLYLLQEYFCGFCSVGHNNAADLVSYWVIPNGFWMVIPLMIVWSMGSDIFRRLAVADGKFKKA